MLVDVTVKRAKELDDVMVALVHLVTAIKSGKGLSEIVLSELKTVQDAVIGIDQVMVELEDSQQVALETIGFRVGSLTNALLAKP